MENIREHIPSLETCKRMHELGWQPEGLFYWSTDNKNSSEFYNDERMWFVKLNPDVAEDVRTYGGEDFKYNISAPTLSEILYEVNKRRSPYNIVNIQLNVVGFLAYFYCEYDTVFEHRTSNPAESAARLWCELVEEEIIHNHQ